MVTIDRICQEEADAKEDVRRDLERTGRPLRSSADSLSDDELLTKLRGFGLDVDSAAEVAGGKRFLVGEEAVRRAHDRL